MAHWLDTACAQFDLAVLSAIHAFAEATNGFFTTPMHVISFFAHDGIGMILLGLLLLCFRKTRRTGLCVCGAILIGALITNVTLKNLVARARPYADPAGIYFQWWQSVGAPIESDLSFPSGHTTATMAAMSAIFLTAKKKYSWTVFVFVALMGFSRMYLVVHYPTDVLAGLLAGAIGATLSYLAVRTLWQWMERHCERHFCRFVTTFDPIDAWRARRTAKKTDTE